MTKQNEEIGIEVQNSNENLYPSYEELVKQNAEISKCVELNDLISELERIRNKILYDHWTVDGILEDYLKLRARAVEANLDVEKIEDAAFSIKNFDFFPEYQQKFETEKQKIRKESREKILHSLEKYNKLHEDFDRRILVWAAFHSTNIIMTLIMPDYFPYFVAGLVLNALDLIVTVARETYQVAKAWYTEHTEPKKIEVAKKKLEDELEAKTVDPKDKFSQRFFKLAQECKKQQQEVEKSIEKDKISAPLRLAVAKHI